MTSSGSADTYVMNQFLDNYEKVMKNREIMKEGAEAVRHFIKLGLIQPSEEEKKLQQKKENDYGKRYHLSLEKKLELIDRIDEMRRQGVPLKRAAIECDVKPVTYRYWRRTLKGGKFDG